MKRIEIAVTGIFLLAGTTWGQSRGVGTPDATEASGGEPRVYTGMNLKQCIETALAYSPDLAAAQQVALAAKAFRDEAAGARWPWLDLCAVITMISVW